MIFINVLFICLLLSCGKTNQIKELSQVIGEGLSFSLGQYRLMAQSLSDSTRLPGSTNPVDCSLVTSGTDW